MKKIVVIGPIPRDKITTSTGLAFNRYGGIANTCIALSYMVKEFDQIIPVSNIRKNDEPQIKELFSQFKNIDLSYINSKKDQGAVIEIIYKTQTDRTEIQTGYMLPIYPEDLIDLIDADAYILSPILDNEIPLETVKYLRNNSNGKIIFDAHGQTRSACSNGTRSPKFWVDIDRWLKYIDILKMNILEAKHCIIKKEYTHNELLSFQEVEASFQELELLAKIATTNNVKCLYITLDYRGAICFYYNEKISSLISKHLDALRFELIVDTTGCGESFSAGLTYSLLYNKEDDYLLAGKIGNIVGGIRTQSHMHEIFSEIKSYIL